MIGLRFLRRKVLGLLAVFVILYLSGPVVASIYEIGDRRGPRIYPVWLHLLIYQAVWEFTEHDAKKPRLGFNPPPRPWFYGLD